MDPTFLKKKSINFSLLQTLTTTNWIITKKKITTTTTKIKKNDWKSIIYYSTNNIYQEWPFFCENTTKKIIITTTTTNYFFCFLNDQKPALSELPDPPSPSSPCVFWSIFLLRKKDSAADSFFLQVVLMGFYFDFRATESEWCDIFHPLKLIIIIIIIITTFYYFTKLFVYYSESAHVCGDRIRAPNNSTSKQTYLSTAHTNIGSSSFAYYLGIFTNCLDSRQMFVIDFKLYLLYTYL